MKASNNVENSDAKNGATSVVKSADRVRLGKLSKTKGSNFERETAKKFKNAYGVDLVRTPQSGGFAKKSVKADEFRGDIVSADESFELLLHVECKNQKTWSLPAWLKQAEEDCPKGKIPVVIFHKPNSSKNYITLNLDDFLQLFSRESILKETLKGKS